MEINALVLIGLAFAMAGFFSLLYVTGAILGKLCLAAFVANDSDWNTY